MAARPFLALLAVLALTPRPAAAQPKPDADKDHALKRTRGLDTFTRHVRAVLVERCVKCHGGKTTEADLDITDRDRLLKGGESGPAILSERGQESLLYKLCAHLKEPHMPHQGRKLDDATLRHLASWIDDGAPYDGPLVTRGKPEGDWTKKTVPPEARRWWAFQPLQRHPIPAVADVAWGRNPVDRFVRARQESAGLTPNAAVDRRRLARRVFFDLVGLPPTPEDVEAFVRDPDPDATAKLVDRLLASPRYGERWGRHWLDLARFAESHGFEHDYDRPTAYPYRDFVVKALNEGMPYDRFAKWQIAGDEYAPTDPLALTATGFLAAGVHSTQITKSEVERHRYDELDDKLSTVGTAFLGLTVGCARCHDHKFDPIPQADYYRLLSAFTTTVRSEVELDDDPEGFKKAKAAFDAVHEPLAAALKKHETEVLPGRLKEWEKSSKEKPPSKPTPAATKALAVAADKRTPEQTAALLAWFRTTDAEWQKLSAKVKESEARAPKRTKALVCSEGLPPLRLHSQGEDFLKETHFLRRGDPNQKDAVAAPGYLQVLMPSADAAPRWQTPPPAGARTSHRRRALAEWLTDVDRGAGALMARVVVNRLWQRHLGRGLVATTSDFGLRGEPPTHPELLDWLASELVRGGWSLKPIHKLIVTSATYAQDSHLDEEKARIDRDNRLVWRRPARRLDAEAIRDALLAVGGALDQRMFGPGTLDEASRRRSVYFTVKRSKLIPMLQVFDAPDALSSVGDRPTTTVAPQALYLMNSPHVRGYAVGLARRAAPDESTPIAEAVGRGYVLALGRPPSDEEAADAAAFVAAQAASYGAEGRARALADFCQTMLCLNEFVYVE